MALTLPVATHERLTHIDRPISRNVVESVLPGGLGERLGLRVGDKVLTVNGHPLRDVVDWKYALGVEEATLVFERDGAQHSVSFEKEFDEDLGLEFADDLFDKLHICKNKCVFCFLYQQPKGLRPSLYVKDDDYRLSFLHGNYVTLTNLKDGELERICEQRLSPLYVSVHATDPEARGLILGRRGPEPILEILETLAEAKIQIHAQVVLVPEYNDGDVLDKTIEDLAALHPEKRQSYGGVLSVAVVPIGITQFRERLAPVKTWNDVDKKRFVAWFEPRRQRFLKQLGTRFVYLSDEFYLGGGDPIPPRSHYEGFPQLEDGVGLVRLFLDDLKKLEKKLPKSVSTPRSFTIATGEIAAPLLQQFADILNRVDGLSVNVCKIHNYFFEGNINIAGLIVGEDLLRGLAEFDGELGETVLIPSVMLRDGEEIFLDELSLEDVRQRAPRPLQVVPRDPLSAAKEILK
jgi:putative radical SAM enzyme (TIGR03279 family)